MEIQRLKEQMTKKLVNLEEHRIALLAELNATLGAMEITKFWLNLIDKPEEPEKSLEKDKDNVPDTA